MSEQAEAWPLWGKKDRDREADRQQAAFESAITRPPERPWLRTFYTTPKMSEREHWRYQFAGQFMSAGIRTPDEAVKLADDLIEALERNKYAYSLETGEVIEIDEPERKP